MNPLTEESRLAILGALQHIDKELTDLKRTIYGIMTVLTSKKETMFVNRETFQRLGIDPTLGETFIERLLENEELMLRIRDRLAQEGVASD